VATGVESMVTGPLPIGCLVSVAVIIMGLCVLMHLLLSTDLLKAEYVCGLLVCIHFT